MNLYFMKSLKLIMLDVDQLKAEWAKFKFFEKHKKHKFFVLNMILCCKLVYY